jgi:predicted enzyme related to lactoylglutathione lyase/DNA-binding CsgD family transcriptional regulator
MQQSVSRIGQGWVGKFREPTGTLLTMAQTRHPRGRPPHPDLLTPAEWQVLDWLRHGLRRADIARRRGTSVDGVKYHLANISGKLGVSGHALRHWPGMPASARANRRTHMPTSNTAAGGLGRIGQVSLCIRDVERATRFYGEVLGLPHLFTFGDLCFFDAADTRLYLHRKDAGDWKPSSVLYFEVDDIQARQQALATAGAQFTGAPHRIHTHDDGTEEWMTFFEDGEGNTLALMSSVQPGASPDRH